MYVNGVHNHTKIGHTSWKGGQNRPVVHCLLLGYHRQDLSSGHFVVVVYYSFNGLCGQSIRKLPLRVHRVQVHSTPYQSMAKWLAVEELQLKWHVILLK